MKRLFSMCVAAVLCFLFISIVQADDQIKLLSENRTVSGNITNITKDVITVNRGGMESLYKVGDIDSISYESEPVQLKAALKALAEGQNETARAGLQTIPDDVSRKEILVERDFLIAQANMRIAFQRGDVSLVQAIAGLEKFNKTHPSSYRHYEAVQMLGELYLETNKPREANTAFTELTKVADAPNIQARGSLGRGRLLLTRGKQGVAEAENMYKSVQKLLDNGEIKVDAKGIQMNVTLGLARCAALNGKFDEAEKRAQSVIDQVSPEDVYINALAYNTLGESLAAGDKKKDAIVAYLHTHLLYNADPVLHMEAMTKLIPLLRDAGSGARADELAAELESRYKK